MLSVLRAEMFKVTHRRMTYILLGAHMGLVLLFYVILWLRLRQGPDHGFQGQIRYLALLEGMAFKNVVPYSLQLERFFNTLVCVIFTATMMGNEYDWRTVGVAVSRGVPRRQFIAAKLVSGIVFTLVAVVLGFLVSMAASAWFSHLYHLPFGTFTVERVLNGFASLGRTTFVALPFVLMALLFATIWRSAGQAVGFALGFFFLEGIFTGLLTSAHGLLAKIPQGMLNINASAVLKANGVLSSDTQDRGPFNTALDNPDVWRGVAILSAYIAVFGIVAFWRFQQRDIQE